MAQCYEKQLVAFGVELIDDPVVSDSQAKGIRTLHSVVWKASEPLWVLSLASLSVLSRTMAESSLLPSLFFRF